MITDRIIIKLRRRGNKPDRPGVRTDVTFVHVCTLRLINKQTITEDRDTKGERYE